MCSCSFSSGTTGPPKIVTRNHRCSVAYKLMGAEPFYFANRPDDCNTHHYQLPFIECFAIAALLVPTPLYHLSDISLLFTSLLNGNKAILQSHAVKSLDFADKYQATTGFVVPSEINYYAKFDTGKHLSTVYDLLGKQSSQKSRSFIVIIAVAGSRPSTKVAQQFLKKYNIDLLRNGYGSTEMGWISMLPHDRVKGQENFNCNGAVLPGVQVKFVDRETGLRLPPNEIGEICIKSPQLFTGYLNNDEANENAYDEQGFFKSGDGGYYDENGLIYVTDRYKEVLKVNGIQVSPTELEMILTSHDDVQEGNCLL